MPVDAPRASGLGRIPARRDQKKNWQMLGDIEAQTVVLQVLMLGVRGGSDLLGTKLRFPHLEGEIFKSSYRGSPVRLSGIHKTLAQPTLSRWMMMTQVSTSMHDRKNGRESSTARDGCQAAFSGRQMCRWPEPDMRTRHFAAKSALRITTPTWSVVATSLASHVMVDGVDLQHRSSSGITFGITQYPESDRVSDTAGLPRHIF
jgi:hypothetical protein